LAVPTISIADAPSAAEAPARGALGCEGIASKRPGSPYRAGRSKHWIKIKNPAAPTARRLEEEDWS
jgi:ATP-dependent DNA ligase